MLTEREREVVALVAKGMSNVEIGRTLFMSPATAKTHAGRAMLKVGARDRAQLVVFAYETGLPADYANWSTSPHSPADSVRRTNLASWP